MKGQITGSIVIYKSNQELLQKAVNSFLNSTTDSILYLIDNSPTDECRDLFRSDRIRYIFNNKNLGFGAGHNIALTRVMANKKVSYHIILNPDVQFESQVTERLSDYMDENPQVGLVMPKVVYPDGRLQPLCRLLPSPVILVARRFLRFNSSWLDQLNHSYEMRFSGYNKLMDVPFLSGCFMFLRLDALRKVGIFDERIFLYTEDADLSRRIHKQYRTIFFPSETIVHYHQRASYKSIPALFHHTRSAIQYFNKWGWFVDAERDFINQRVMLKFAK